MSPSRAQADVNPGVAAAIPAEECFPLLWASAAASVAACAVFVVRYGRLVSSRAAPSV